MGNLAKLIPNNLTSLAAKHGFSGKFEMRLFELDSISIKELMESNFLFVSFIMNALEYNMVQLMVFSY